MDTVYLSQAVFIYLYIFKSKYIYIYIYLQDIHPVQWLLFMNLNLILQ